MDLPSRVECLSDAACDVLDAAVAVGWSPAAATDVLGVVDALGRLGPPARETLAPALAATAELRALVTAPPPPDGTAGTTAPARRRRPPDGRHARPGYWVGRDMRVAEQLWLDAQEGRGGRLADLFAALPPEAMVEAVDRRRRGEDWHQVLQELTRRHRT